jgi:hypothetical protein
VTALVLGPVWSLLKNLHNNHTTDQLNKSALNTTNLKYKALILFILFYNLFEICPELDSCPDLSFWIIIYRKIVDPAKRGNLK